MKRLARLLASSFCALSVVNCSGGIRGGIGVAFEGGRATTGAFALYKVGDKGELNIAGSANAGDRVSHVAITKGAKFAYSTNYNGNTISQYSLGGTAVTTALSPATVACGNSPYRITTNPAVTFAYVSYYGGDIGQFAIGADGTLTALTPATVTMPSPRSLIISPDGKYLYVASGHLSLVYQFSIGTDGQLTPLSPASVSNGSSGNLLDIVSSSDGKNYYIPISTDAVRQYLQGTDGTLSVNSSIYSSLGTGTIGLTLTPNKLYAYTLNADGQIGQYTLSSTGAPIPSVAFQATAGIKAIAADASSKYVFAASSSKIYQFKIKSDGKLEANETASIDAPETNVNSIISFELAK